MNSIHSVSTGPRPIRAGDAFSIHIWHRGTDGLYHAGCDLLANYTQGTTEEQVRQGWDQTEGRPCTGCEEYNAGARPYE